MTGYEDFVDAKYENRQKAEAQNASAKKKIAELQSFVDRFGSHASKSKQAQSRVKQIEKLEVKDLKRTSLVRPFVRFEFDKPMRDAVRAGASVKLGCDHTNYPAHVVIAHDTLASLAGDLT